MREGLIQEFVERRVPADWASWGIGQRRDFWAGTVHTWNDKEIELVERERVCAIEVWCELFNGSPRDASKQEIREINAVLANVKGWSRNQNPLRCGPYNLQRGFVKK